MVLVRRQATPGLNLADVIGYIIQAGLLALENHNNFLPGIQNPVDKQLINSVTVAGPHGIQTRFPFYGIMPT
jgi:hypothetical protein